MNDQEQKNTHHARQIGEGVFAVTAPDQPSEEAVALLVKRQNPDPDHFTQTWIYSEAYVGPTEPTSPVTYQFSYFTFASALWDDPDELAIYLRGTLPKFATGPIKIDTHTVTRLTIPAP